MIDLSNAVVNSSNQPNKNKYLVFLNGDKNSAQPSLQSLVFFYNPICDLTIGASVLLVKFLEKSRRNLKKTVENISEFILYELYIFEQPVSSRAKQSVANILEERGSVRQFSLV